jgi:predicted secreted acid phosphatase
MTTYKVISEPGGPLLMEVDSAATAVRWALAYLGCTRTMATKPAVCFDIDGTVLLNATDGSTKCVRHLKSLVHACQAAGISVFYITARLDTPENRESTEKQLRDCNINTHVRLFMLSQGSEYARYKYRSRLEVVQMGHTILLSVGDQFADLTRREMQLDDDRFYVGQIGDNGAFGIKLPSEFRYR